MSDFCDASGALCPKNVSLPFLMQQIRCQRIKLFRRLTKDTPHLLAALAHYAQALSVQNKGRKNRVCMIMCWPTTQILTVADFKKKKISSLTGLDTMDLMVLVEAYAAFERQAIVKCRPDKVMTSLLPAHREAIATTIATELQSIEDFQSALRKIVLEAAMNQQPLRLLRITVSLLSVQRPLEELLKEFRENLSLEYCITDGFFTSDSWCAAIGPKLARQCDGDCLFGRYNQCTVSCNRPQNMDFYFQPQTCPHAFTP